MIEEIRGSKKILLQFLQKFTHYYLYTDPNINTIREIQNLTFDNHNKPTIIWISYEKNQSNILESIINELNDQIILLIETEEETEETEDYMSWFFTMKYELQNWFRKKNELLGEYNIEKQKLYTNLLKRLHSFFLKTGNHYIKQIFICFVTAINEQNRINKIK